MNVHCTGNSENAFSVEFEKKWYSFLKELFWMDALPFDLSSNLFYIFVAVFSIIITDQNLLKEETKNLKVKDQFN